RGQHLQLALGDAPDAPARFRALPVLRAALRPPIGHAVPVLAVVGHMLRQSLGVWHGHDATPGRGRSGRGVARAQRMCAAKTGALTCLLGAKAITNLLNRARLRLPEGFDADGTFRKRSARSIRVVGSGTTAEKRPRVPGADSSRGQTLGTAGPTP